jgi:hypothetical protein
MKFWLREYNSTTYARSDSGRPASCFCEILFKLLKVFSKLVLKASLHAVSIAAGENESVRPHSSSTQSAKWHDAGDHFHGQFDGRGWTHGCLYYGTDTRMIDCIWSKMPNIWVGVGVDVPVIKP